MDPILSFFRGGKDDSGRTLDEILAWDDQELEDVHDYIQWVFPTRQRSAFNPTAPTLSDDAISAFQGDAALRERLLAAFRRMLRFYGFETIGEAIEPGRNWNERREWIAPGDHNLLRITRILDCLCTLGLAEKAQAFLRALEALGPEERRAIGPRTFQFWREAVR